MKRLLLYTLFATLFAACTQNEINEQSVNRQEVPKTLTVGFEGADDDTRIQLNEAQKTVWTKGDHVSVFYRSAVNEDWQFMGETGDRTGNITPVDNSVNPPATHNRVVVVYPYNEGYYLNSDNYNIEASLPAVQNYLKDSYGTNGNIMVSSSNYKQVSLKSVCGWLKLQLTGDGEVVKSITLRGNNGEQVAGELYINSADATAVLASEMGSSDDNNAGGSLVFDDTILTEVTLDCGEGVALGKNATAFYIALPPQTFDKGFTVEIEDIDGYVMEQSTNNIVSIERNHIQPMAAFEFVNPNTPSTPKPANNEIWYTATAKTEPYFDDFLTFGADVVSNVWDSETKKGVITFDGEVTMIGDDAFNNCDKFTGITLPDSVTSIGKKAFYDCDGLTEFTIPDGVTEIRKYAFCSCGKLANVAIGDSVTTIGDSAFYSCSSLTSVTIGDSVTSIGEDAFYKCSNLTSVYISDIATWCNISFSNGHSNPLYHVSNLYLNNELVTDLTIPDSVTTIGDYAFYYCDSLTSVTIPDSVTTIGEYAFCGCTSLTSVTIPDGVTTIGDHVFYYCYSLTSVTIPASVTTIGNYAFSSCSSLTSVTIPDSVTTIGYDAFLYCTSLTSVTIPDSVTTIGNEAFYWCTSLKKVYCNATIPPSIRYDVFSSNASGRRIYVYEECVDLYKSAWSNYADSIYTNGHNCPYTTIIEYTTSDGNTITSSNLPIISNTYENGVGKLVLSGNLSQIPSSAFSNCSSLTSITIPDGVTSIGEDAFYKCSNLTSVTIPDSVTTIGGFAFSYCESLTSVTIPNSVTTIGGWAFAYCRSLTSVYCKAITPPVLNNSYVFSANGSGRKIYVPTASVDAYKSTGYWSEYASAIEGYDFDKGEVVE